MVDTATLASQKRVNCYRACDRRFPFLWATKDQPPGRWHDVGEGPCHYLASTPKGAWAEIVRHEEITDADDLADLELAFWEVDAPWPEDQPELDAETLAGGLGSYPACREEAQRLRANGSPGLVAPSAAVRSGHAEVFGVDLTGQCLVGFVPANTVVLFGRPDGLNGMPLGQGHPESAVLGDVRHF